MNGPDFDRELQRLRDAAARIGANLLELDQDPNRSLLETASLEGGTAARWEAARDALAGLFQSFAALTSLLDRATARRGTRSSVPASREAELSALLQGPSIALSDTTVPLAERDLLSGSRAVQRCTPDELLTRMSDAFDAAKAVIIGAGDVWDTVVPRLRGARERLALLTELATSLGEQPPSCLAGLSRELEDLSRLVLTDPLSLDRARVDGVDRQLKLAADDLRAPEALRDDFEARIARARELLADTRHAIDDCEEVCRHTSAKLIIEAPDGMAFDPQLAEQLEHIVQRSESGMWRSAAVELAEWQERADDLRRGARAVADAHRAALQQRVELRGRLDAYLAKAGHRSRLEDDELTALYERARSALYTAPTDLVLAGELVRSYQQALAGGGSGTRQVAR
jgi:hypothetical protein